MIVVGDAIAAGTSVTIPPHQVGDIIILSARRASASLPTKPTASGSVPNWVVMQQGGNTSVSMYMCYFVATRPDHTGGVWTNADYVSVIVLRGESLRVAHFPAGVQGAGYGMQYYAPASSSQYLTYAGITLPPKYERLFGVRIGTRSTANIAVGTAPAGWTRRHLAPDPTALIALHTRADIVANEVDAAIDCAAAAYYRAFTILVHESRGNIRVT